MLFKVSLLNQLGLIDFGVIPTKLTFLKSNKNLIHSRMSNLFKVILRKPFPVQIAEKFVWRL
jgi:hypothetical protein